MDFFFIAEYTKLLEEYGGNKKSINNKMIIPLLRDNWYKHFNVFS